MEIETFHNTEQTQDNIFPLFHILEILHETDNFYNSTYKHVALRI